MALKFVQPAFRKNDRRYFERVIPFEFNSIEPAESRRYLVLRSDVFMDNILFDMDRILCELFLRGVLSLQRRQCVNQADSE